MISSFNFRTPPVPPSSNEFPLPPFDVNFSIYFDNSIISLPNLIQFHYIPDVLLNISSIPPILPYTGEELKLQVENLTEAASMADIQLLIGCSECKLKTFTSKGITCQPPAELITNTAIVLNNQQQQGLLCSNKVLIFPREKHMSDVTLLDKTLLWICSFTRFFQSFRQL
jgi:hypothetical protein